MFHEPAMIVTHHQLLDQRGSDPRFPERRLVDSPSSKGDTSVPRTTRFALVYKTSVCVKSPEKVASFQPHHHAITISYRPDIMMRAEHAVAIMENEHQPKGE
jgi:hypothetical protein